MAACSGTTIITDYSERAQAGAARNLLIFMDGTSNDLNSVTNVSRLHAFAKNQNRQDLAIFYTSGVGADGTGIIGMGSGLGIGRDVRSAYRFLAETYRDGADIAHLYGYSRGAYAARILAGFLYTVGLVDIAQRPDGQGGWQTHSGAERDALIAELYRA